MSVTCSHHADTGPEAGGDAGSGARHRLDTALDAAIGPAASLGVAISGGSDSTALLLAASDWAATRGVRLFAATVDHGMRPEAADEARAAGRLCADLGAPHETLCWRPPSVAASQDAARRARHRLLAEWAAANALDAIALGHTQDDRIETFMMRARAGSGWWGLAGPLPSAPSPVWPEGRGVRLARPLLTFGREELRNGLRARGRSWIDDPSNANRRYERVRTRALAQRLTPGASAGIVRVMNRLGVMRAAVMAEGRCVLESAESLGDDLVLRLDRLAAMSAEGRLHLIEALVMAAGVGHRPPAVASLARVAAMTAPGGTPAPRTLAGAWFRPGRSDMKISPAPPRREAGKSPSRPDWDRAAGLLADPHIGALFV